jgi:hypothetical protein
VSGRHCAETHDTGMKTSATESRNRDMADPPSPVTR